MIIIQDPVGLTSALLVFNDFFPEDVNMPTREEILKNKHKPSSLISEVMTFVVNNWDKSGENEDKILTTHQLLTCIHEIYTHSRQRSADNIDQDFSQWHLNLIHEIENVDVQKVNAE